MYAIITINSYVWYCPAALFIAKKCNHSQHLNDKILDPVAVYSSEKNIRLCNCLQLIVDVSAFGFFPSSFVSHNTDITILYLNSCMYLLKYSKKTDRCHRIVSATEETCDVYNLFVMNSNICVCYYFTFVVICAILKRKFPIS